jgi:hypothetical protein
MRKKDMLIGLVGVVVGVLLSSVVVVLAGSLDSPGGPDSDAAQMYTLEQIYDRLSDGRWVTKMTTFTEPSSGPDATGRTLDEVMAVAKPGALAKRVSKTGQTQCWNQSGGSIACSGTGQDGEYKMGIKPAIAPEVGVGTAYKTPAWTGVRFTDNGDGTVTDNLTALIWLKNANCFGTRTWAEALSDANGLASGSCGLSDGSSAGEWRLPNVNELNSLVDLGQGGSPKLPAGHPFSGVKSFYYWSSTTFEGSKHCAWIVGLHDGIVGFDAKTGSSEYVWPVRGGS